MMHKNKFRVIIMIVLLICIICLIRCYSAYIAAASIKNELINQFEEGYKDYLHYLDNDLLSDDIYNIMPQYITNTFENPQMNGRYIMLKDSIIEYKKAKKHIEEESLEEDGFKLSVSTEMCGIIPTPFNSASMSLYFREFSLINKNVCFLGSNRRLEVKLKKKSGKWYIDYIVNKPVKYYNAM